MNTVTNSVTEATNLVGATIGNLYEGGADAESRSDVLHDHNGTTRVAANDAGDIQFRSDVLHDHGTIDPLQDAEPFRIDFSQADSLSRSDALHDHG